MRKLALVLGVVAALVAAQAAGADILRYTDGGAVKGTLTEATVLVDGLQRICLRPNIASFKLGEDGATAIGLQGDTKLEGKLASIKFKSSDGIIVVGLGKIQSIEFDPEWKEPEDTQEPEVATAKTEPEPEKLTDAQAAQKDLLSKNSILYDRAGEKADEMEKGEKQAIKAKYINDVRALDNEIRALESSIANKRARRSQGAGASTDRNGNRTYNDGLDADMRSLDRAKKRLDDLGKKIKAETADVDKSAAERKKRLQVVQSENKRTILEGKELSVDQMITKYKGALGQSASEAKDTKKQDG